MKEIFIKICRDLPQGLRASSHQLGGINIYRTNLDSLKVVLTIQEQTKWDPSKGTYKRTGRYLISQGGFGIYKKDLSFSQAVDLTKQLLGEL